MVSLSLLYLVVLVSLTSAVNDVQSGEDRINAFRRCIAGTDLPPFNTTRPTCPISTTALLKIATNSRYQSGFHFGCDDLMYFADYIDQNDIELEDLTSVTLKNITHTSWLSTAAYYCHRSVIRKLCTDHDMCITNNATKMYWKESCEMEFLRLVSRKSNGDFSEKIYNYLVAVAMLWSNFFTYYSGYNSAIPQHYLSTCRSQMHDTETCTLSLLSHCFELEEVYYNYPYWCYDGVLERLCIQFHGDEKFRCQVVLETRLEFSLESQCANEKNEGKCENILTGIVDYKPISQLNSSDVDQMKAVVAGSAQRSNYTNQTLTQLNKIINYFSSNESAVANVIDKQDATTFLTVINTLASEDGTQALAGDNSSNTSGAMLLHDLDEISKVIGIAVVSGNDKVDGKFAFNDNNIGLFLAVGSDTESYSSGDLKLNKTNSSSFQMTAAINIPPSSVCNKDIDESSASADGDDFDEMYTYNYPKICNGLPRCTRVIYGYEYVFYDFYTLFGDCSKKLQIPTTCPSVVTTSIADSIPSLLSNDLPPNMTIASLLLSSQIVTMDAENAPFVLHNLREKATLQFKLIRPVNLTTHTPSCYYWDSDKMEWSNNGIETEVLTDEDVRCKTNHLTSFAVLIDHQGLIERDSIPYAEKQALSIVGYIGPSFSAVCLVIAIVIMAMLRKQMQNSLLYCIHLNLCISLLMAIIVLLVGLETANEVDWLCSLVAGLLHYLFLCVFSWMLAEGITLFIMVVYVWGAKFLKWYIFVPLAWGIPVFIVAISVGIRHDLYGTNNFCWLSFEQGLMWAFLGPVVAIALANTIFLIVTVVQVVRVTRKKVENNFKRAKNIQIVKSAIVGSVVLFPLLGITWIIGIFAVSQKTTVFLWLFTICNSLQGVFILVFHVLKHKAFLIWLARRFPCLDRYITVHSSVEASRRLSMVKHSVSSKGLQSDKFGVKALVKASIIQNTNQLEVIEEDENSSLDNE